MFVINKDGSITVGMNLETVGPEKSGSAEPKAENVEAPKKAKSTKAK